MATLTDDGEMVYRITNDGFAVNALYHTTCMTNYLLKRIKDDSEDYLTSENDILFQSFISTIKEDSQKDIHFNPTARTLFSEFLPSDRKKSCTSHRLQQKLERHFGDLITIQPQQGHGMSNLIYSSAISTPEAIGAATRIKADMHSATVHDLSNVAHICDESQILHAAAGILRRQISDITISDDEYPAPEEVSISNAGAKVASSLKMFMCWLLDDSAFESANDSTSVPI